MISSRPLSLLRPYFLLLLVCLAFFCVSGCSLRPVIVGSLADELAAQAGADEDDLELARDAAPFYLKLSESVLRQQPAHRPLASAVAAGYAQYAYAFVAFEAERREATDVAQATRLRQRAAGLYRRAQRHALHALTEQYPSLPAALRGAGPAPRLAEADVGLAYWAAAAWGGWISLAKDDPEVVADLPLAVRLCGLAHAQAPAWGDGALSSLRASFEAARPGGDRAQALRWFDLAIAQAGPHPGAALLAKAEGHALPAGDRALFESLLRQVLAAEAVPGKLQQRIVQQRAAWLLEQSPDLF